tara:strand:- start:38212 stop:39243 length:1032 start_codon:yes stop_codon:yes gene_type:complete
VVNSTGSSREVLPWHSLQRERLISQFRSGKVPHAFLFSGLEGLGKSQFASFLASFMLCENSKTQQVPCGECKQCRLFESESHPDFKLLEPEEGSASIKVDQVRQLVEFFGKSSQQGGLKIALVSPAEALNNNAANALLKTLEEPSGQSVIILVSHQPGMLLPTIRSRCQLVDFTRPELNVSLTWLKANSINEAGQNVPSDEDLEEVLSLAYYSPLKAMYYIQLGALKEYQRMLDEMGTFLKNETLSSTLATRWNDDLAHLRVAWMAHWLELILKIKLDSVDNEKILAQKMLKYLAEKASHAELFDLYSRCLAQYRLFLGTTNPNKILAFESLLHKWSILMRKG